MKITIMKNFDDLVFGLINFQFNTHIIGFNKPPVGIRNFLIIRANPDVTRRQVTLQKSNHAKVAGMS